MRLLVSGGTGYLASNLLNYAHNEGFWIKEPKFILDRSIKETINSKNNMEFFLGSITSAFADIMFFRPSICLHSAYVGDLEAEYKFLEFLAKKSPEIYLVYFSSAAVYGDAHKDTDPYSKIPSRAESIRLSQALKLINKPKLKSFSETDEPQPISEYGLYKFKIEQFIQKNFANHLILRISNPYGNEIRTRGFYPMVQEQILQQQSIKINADYPGQIIRDFIHIEDLAKQVLTLIKNQAQGIHNISSGQAQTLEEFLAANFQGDLDLVYSGYLGEIRYSCLANSLKSLI